MTGVRWLTLAVVSAATAMLLLDVTVVNVALPTIRSDLDGSFAEEGRTGPEGPASLRDVLGRQVRCADSAQGPPFG